MHSIIKLTSSLVTVALLSACGGDNSTAPENSIPDSIVVSPVVYNQGTLAKITFVPALNTVIEVGGEVNSAPITIDIQGEEKISIVNGLYSINGNEFTHAEGIIKNGETLVIKQILPEDYETSITTTVTIGSTTISFTNSTPEAPDDNVEVPEGAISFKFTCQPNPAACGTSYSKAKFYDGDHNLIKQVDILREITTFAETGTDQSTIALTNPNSAFPTNSNALVFLSLDNQHYDYDLPKGGVLGHYEPDECKSYTVILDGLSGHDLKPSHRFDITEATSFDVIAYDRNLGTAELSLTSCGNEGVVISEINSNIVTSFIDIPVNEIVEGDVINLTMKQPWLITAQVDNARLAVFTSINEDNTAHISSSGIVGKDAFYLYPTPNAHYLANVSANDTQDNDDFKSQFYYFSALPENDIFSEQMFDIEIEDVAFDLETLTLNYSVSGNDAPSIILFSLQVTYEVVTDGVSKEYKTTTSIFSQHSTTPLTFPNVHADFIPDGAEVIKVAGKLNAIKTNYYDNLNAAMGFGITPQTLSPMGFSREDGVSGFFTSEYYIFFEKD